MMKSYTELATAIKAKDDTWFFSGKQEQSRIDEVEAKFKVRFPESYKRFLLEVGCLDYADHHYSGIDDDYLDPFDGIMGNTMMAREEFELPSNLFCLEADHDAHELACLELDKMRDNECPVVWFNVYSKQVVGKVSDDFDTFIRERLEPWI
ncbi:MAG: SMI1/KNR4 family protein [Gammaproteobacteria bacterium]|nr:SMI1/KNR4 family protein [Gammaproteobacteria bacterium]